MCEEREGNDLDNMAIDANGTAIDPNYYQGPIYYNYGSGVIQQGWQCPKCQRIYAPANLECWNCNQWLSLQL